jgi:hypothetical protein
LGNTDPKEFIPFLLFFAALFTLLKKRPGKPWIILIAFVGNIYGWIMATFLPDYCPLLLK